MVDQVEVIDIQEETQMPRLRSSTGDEKFGGTTRDSNSRSTLLLRSNPGVRMQFDPSKAPEGTSNPK